MGYRLEFKTLLRLPTKLGESELCVGDRLHIIKKGERIYPLHEPIDLYDELYHYLGKIILMKLILEKGRTVLYGEVVSLLQEDVASFYSN